MLKPPCNTSRFRTGTITEQVGIKCPKGQRGRELCSEWARWSLEESSSHVLALALHRLVMHFGLALTLKSAELSLYHSSLKVFSTDVSIVIRGSKILRKLIRLILVISMSR